MGLSSPLHHTDCRPWRTRWLGRSLIHNPPAPATIVMMLLSGAASKDAGTVLLPFTPSARLVAISQRFSWVCSSSCKRMRWYTSADGVSPRTCSPNRFISPSNLLSGTVLGLEALTPFTPAHGACCKLLAWMPCLYKPCMEGVLQLSLNECSGMAQDKVLPTQGSLGQRGICTQLGPLTGCTFMGARHKRAPHLQHQFWSLVSPQLTACGIPRM